MESKEFGLQKHQNIGLKCHFLSSNPNYFSAPNSEFTLLY
ncbi:hypothetical protein [Acinetobacter bereziniae]|nr:hypothetical protein ACINWC743_3405 [Acinetobacter sp. WC-743]CEI54753.1 hypothetical protein [Acinetobacter bereziniae]